MGIDTISPSRWTDRAPSRWLQCQRSGGRDDLELATLEWVDWFYHRRLSGALRYVPPAEYEANHRREQVLAGAGAQ